MLFAISSDTVRPEIMRSAATIQAKSTQSSQMGGGLDSTSLEVPACNDMASTWARPAGGHAVPMHQAMHLALLLALASILSYDEYRTCSHD